MPIWFIDLCGWIPGIIYPGASLLQLLKLCRSKSSEGVSVVTWLLFSGANVATFIYVQKYDEPQTFGFLIAAAAQFAIVVVAFVKRRPEASS